MPNLRPNKFLEFFHLQSTLNSEIFSGVSGYQLFLVMSNFRSKIFWNFFIYRVLWTLNFSLGGGSIPNLFGDAKFETKQFFGIFTFT